MRSRVRNAVKIYVQGSVLARRYHRKVVEGESWGSAHKTPTMTGGDAGDSQGKVVGCDVLKCESLPSSYSGAI